MTNGFLKGATNGTKIEEATFTEWPAELMARLRARSVAIRAERDGNPLVTHAYFAALTATLRDTS